MEKWIGFMGFTPSRFSADRPLPVKISFYHIQSGFSFSQTIREHENWVGYELKAKETLVALDTDSAVTLESCSIDGQKVRKVISGDEMKCLMHYIVFFIKKYERIADKAIWETDVKILQNDVYRAKLSIKITATFVRGGSYIPVDFKEPTAFETIGKDGNIYGIYELKCMGVSIEAPIADPSVDLNKFEICISRDIDLRKGSCENDEVAICPTVKIIGIFDGNPVELTLSHCAELSLAALDRNVTIVVYEQLEPASGGDGKLSLPRRSECIRYIFEAKLRKDNYIQIAWEVIVCPITFTNEEGKVSRRELTRKIKKDTLSFFIDGPGLYTASIKDDICEGKRVALLAFLPTDMPENRRPILHVNCYYPFGEIGKRIREEWEEKDNICVKEETTFILKHIDQDAEVSCELTSLTQNPGPLISMLESQTLDRVPYECFDFELDYTSENTNKVTIKLRVFQEECRSEIDITQTLKDPQSDEPKEVEMEPEPEPEPESESEPEPEPEPEQEPEPIHLRIPKRVTDEMIGAMSSRKIHADQLSVLANALGFSTKDFGRFVSDNMSSAGGRRGFAGTKKLLTRWRNRTDESHQRPELREAFRRSNIADLTKRYLKEKDDSWD